MHSEADEAPDFPTEDVFSCELSAINRLIVAEEDGPVERRYSFPVGILLGR